MKYNKSYIYSFLLFTIFTACHNEKDVYIINDNSNLEFRINIRPEKGQLMIIENGSKEYERLKAYINNLEDLNEVEYINTYPFYTINGEDLRIQINVDSIYIEYLNQKQEHIKLSKKISIDEFLDFNYLSHSDNRILDLGNLYGIGYIKKDKYTECGIVPQEIEYHYKVGKWKFWNLERNLIAEGEFEIDSALAKGRGGCDFMVKMSKVKNRKWKFFNGNGEETKGTIEQIYNIENAK
ncbi:hypothetical protein [Winogradskyella sp. SYSU M77433]|uniref:hypothetical protein n=1 Tax=Winogradskyella sp. SYSU M77433 TaxID=3042722 RepID=UPI0024807699|nr:hypothetical protein [Winogradskyella sp. SYSU M77433]MDH7913219.1 hypothetical protein [Winogradskyella sp. SYSU M77433]